MSELGLTRPAAKRSRWTGAALSLGAHVGLILALFTGRAEPPPAFEPQLMTLTLIDLAPPDRPGPAPGGEPAQAPSVKPTPDKPNPVKTPPQRIVHRPVPAPPEVEPVPAGDPSDALTEAQIAGAMTAGSGSGSGSGSGAGAGPGACNMPQWLQAELRKDPLVQAAVRQAHRGKPIMVWNGDWVRRADQEGNGLAAVREALMWEIAFAPEACRRQPVRGLVLLSLNDAPGAARLVVGADAWRWTDLLFSGHAPPGASVSGR